jgi:hypothetical protein
MRLTRNPHEHCLMFTCVNKHRRAKKKFSRLKAFFARLSTFAPEKPMMDRLGGVIVIYVKWIGSIEKLMNSTLVEV